MVVVVVVSLWCVVCGKGECKQIQVFDSMKRREIMAVSCFDFEIGSCKHVCRGKQHFVSQVGKETVNALSTYRKNFHLEGAADA